MTTKKPAVPRVRKSIVATCTALALLGAACGTDDGAGVNDVGGDDSTAESASGSASSGESGSASGSGSGSASAPADDGATDAPDDATSEDGGYEYASNVDSHRLVVADLCGIGDLLDAGDFPAVEAVYRDGVNSVNSDGTIRSIGGFAARDDRNHGLDVYYGVPTPLDDFVSDALAGSGMFDGQAESVRAQAVEKGMQNQIMVAWVVHELRSALDKAADGDFDVAEGAVHNWDEGWAFYHGSEPGCAPYATADKRAENFGTLGDGETALANEAILDSMIAGRDALLAEDGEGASAAADEVVRNVVITYSQAAIRYASLIETDLGEDNADAAKEHQAEGLAFWRVIEALVEPAGADAAAVNAIFALENEPGANGFGSEVSAALQPAWDELAISPEDIGELE